jgi:hypothetical protein
MGIGVWLEGPYKLFNIDIFPLPAMRREGHATKEL